MIKDRIRTLLNIRVKRELPGMGTKPRSGAKIALGNMRLHVTCEPPDELWYFFSLQGWREVGHPRDRRKYFDLPRASLDLLIRCNSSDREERYRQLIAAAARARSTGRSMTAAPAGKVSAR